METDTNDLIQCNNKLFKRVSYLHTNDLIQNEFLTYLFVLGLFLYHCVTFRGEDNALRRSEGGGGTGGDGEMGRH